MKHKFVVYSVLIIIICIMVFLPHLITNPNNAELNSDDVLIAAVREFLDEQIHEDTKIAPLGFVRKDNWLLYWFCIGDDAYHSYITGEFAITKTGRLHPIGFHKPINRGGDVASIQWSEGYSFLVNSSNCTAIELVTSEGIEVIKVDTIPFVYYLDCIPFSYRFLDETMEEI